MSYACRIKVGALPEAIVTGTLTRIAPQAQRSEGATLFDVEIELDPDQDVFLRAGYSANADIVIREKTDIVMIPNASCSSKTTALRPLSRCQARGPSRTHQGRGRVGAVGWSQCRGPFRYRQRGSDRAATSERDQLMKKLSAVGPRLSERKSMDWAHLLSSGNPSL